MTTHFLCVSTLVRKDGIAKDNVQNTWAFRCNDTTTDIGVAAAARGAIEEFFVTAVGAGDPVGSYISDQISRAAGGLIIETYKFDPTVTHTTPKGAEVPIMGSPIDVYSTSLPVAGSGHLPEECAAVLSFNSDLTGLLEESGTTRPKARHRGRIFLGPLTGLALSVDSTTNETRVSTGLRTAATAAAQRLQTSVTVSGVHDIDWCVWSRKNKGMTRIVSAWMDNAFDTQRRRGSIATARTTVTVP